MKKKFTFLFVLFFLLPGAILASDEIPIATGSFSQTYPTVVFDGEDFFTVYGDRRGGDYSYYANFITEEGTVSNEQLIVPPHPAMSLFHGLAKGDDNFLFTWSRQRGQFDYQRDGMSILIGNDGNPVSGIIQVSGPQAVHSPSFMRTAFDGENYLVIWQDGMPNQDAQIMAQFVSASDYNLVGQNFVIRPDDLTSNDAQVYPDILFDGTNYLVVWDDNRSGERSIYGWFIDTDGNPVGDDFVISDEPQRQLLVRAAYNGTHYMAVWGDRRHGNKSGVYGQMFDNEGNLVGDEIVISPLENNEGRDWPRVESNGNQFLVAWDRQIISKNQEIPVDKITEETYKAAGVEAEKSTIWYEVHGRMINADGSHASDELIIGANQYHQRDPEIAASPEQFMVVWMDSRVNNQYSDIYGIFLEAEAPDELPVPENLTAEFTGEAVELNWEAPAGKELLHYNVYKDGEILETDVEATTFTDMDFEQETTYTYYITAVYDEGESDPSNIAEVDIPTLFVSVTFMVMEAETGDKEANPIEDATVSLEGFDDQMTDENGMAVFEEVSVDVTLAYEVSKEGYFMVDGTLEITDEDKEVEVMMEVDDTSIDDLAASADIILSPNPARQHLNISSQLKMEQITVLDLMGKTHLNLEGIDQENVVINVSDLRSGIYLIRVIGSNQQVETLKFIKE